MPMLDQTNMFPHHTGKVRMLHPWKGRAEEFGFDSAEFPQVVQVIGIIPQTPLWTVRLADGREYPAFHDELRPVPASA